MRAVQIRAWGGPEVLELADLPVPEPGPGEVLVRVSRAGVNFADTHQRTNSYLAKAQLPLVPGSEVAGVREDTGERVLALCGQGGYAQYATAPAERTFPIPDGVDDGVALALLVQGLTAWHILRTCAHLRAGESVVVHSAAGGVGSLAVQLARAFGAGRIVATASTPEKRRTALELGADAAVGAEPEGMAQRLVEANRGRELDVVLEMAGGEVFEQSLQALAPFGRLVAYGISSGQQSTVRTGALMRRSQAVVGFWLMRCLGRRDMVDEALSDLFARVRRGELRAIVGATYPLSEVSRAHEDLAGRRTTGKLVVDPSG